MNIQLEMMDEFLYMKYKYTFNKPGNLLQIQFITI